MTTIASNRAPVEAGGALPLKGRVAIVARRLPPGRHAPKNLAGALSGGGASMIILA